MAKYCVSSCDSDIRNNPALVRIAKIYNRAHFRERRSGGACEHVVIIGVAVHDTPAQCSGPDN